MLIKKENIEVRNADIYDAENIVRWWNDGAVMAHAGFPHGLGIKFEEVVDQIIESSMSKNGEFNIIVIDGIAVGEASFTIKESVAYPGWKICEKKFQDQGYGPKLILMYLDYIFKAEKYNNPKKIEKIYWDANLANARAIHVYENKIRARRVKTLMDSWEDANGNLQSSVEFEITREEFYKLHGDSEILKKSDEYEVLRRKIQNSSFEIKEITDEDLEKIYKIEFVDKKRDSNLFDGPYFTSTENYNNFTEFRDSMQKFYKNKSRKGIYINGNIVGIVTRYFEDEKTRWMEFGIDIFEKKYWSSGIGFKALKIWITESFKEYPELRSLSLTTWNGNPMMMKLSEKLGLKKEAQRRKVRYYKDYYFDSVSYGILREEWDEKNN